MTGEVYVQSVIDHVPVGTPQREQIAMELRGHIAERLAQGQTLPDVLQQLGDPLALAESYLAAVPLRSADILDRIGAKVIDVLVVCAVAAGVAALAWLMLPPEKVFFVPVLCALVGVLGFVIYTIVAEYRTGRTLGKRLTGMQVVRESGARISLGQAVVRQIPFFAQFFLVDALFALFTDRRQRAFELLTKTRVIATVLWIVLLAGPRL